MFKWLFTEEHHEKKRQAKQQREALKHNDETIQTEKPEPKSRPRPAPSRSYRNSITINDDVIIVNGKRLEKDTPEYQAYKDTFHGTMDEFHKEMKELGNDMRELGKDMRDMFK